MINLTRKLWQLQGRVRTLRRAISLRDALRLGLGRRTQGEEQVFVRALGRKVWIRLGTSDYRCVEKVFACKEYDFPFGASPQVIVDAGANVGMATLYFADRYPGARIIAIEPEHSNFAALRRNCEGLPNVALIQAALWPDDGRRLTLADASAEKWAFSVSEFRPGVADQVEVPTITMCQVLGQVDKGKVDILKLDIEGAELELFSSDSKTWLDCVDSIVVELHDRLRPGCAKALYSALVDREFVQEIKGENIFVRLLRDVRS